MTRWVERCSYMNRAQSCFDINVCNPQRDCGAQPVCNPNGIPLIARVRSQRDCGFQLMLRFQRDCVLQLVRDPTGLRAHSPCPIPTGLRRTAQGCSTQLPWVRVSVRRQPRRGCGIVNAVHQRNRRSLQGSECPTPPSQGSRVRQPWAAIHNHFVVENRR